MGFAPKQEFCFIIDSYQPAGVNQYHRMASPHRDLYAMLLHFAPNAGHALERWNIWMHCASKDTDSTATSDTGPNAPRQYDGWNCGIHAAVPTFTRMTDEEEDALFKLVKPSGYSDDPGSDPEDKTAESDESSDDDDFDMDGYGDNIDRDGKKKGEDRDDDEKEGVVKGIPRCKTRLGTMMAVKMKIWKMTKTIWKKMRSHHTISLNMKITTMPEQQTNQYLQETLFKEPTSTTRSSKVL